MSNAWESAGWWLASDGRWYPPHLHPSYRAPAPTIVARPSRPLPRPASLSRRARLVYALVTLAFVGLVTASISAVTGTGPVDAEPSGTAPTSGPLKPAPGHLVVGKSVTLPPVLYQSADPGAPSLVTPSGARAVTAAIWREWEAALVSSDTRALSELAPPGPMLAGTIDNCAFPSGRCVHRTRPRSLTNFETIVPVQTSYPIYFLAEIQTTQYVDPGDGDDAVEPWVELQILTKASSSAPWQLSFDTEYDGIRGAQPPLLPFDLGPVSTSTAGDRYNPPPEHAPPVPADQFLPLLAQYWQSYKDTGKPPQASIFVAGGNTSGVGEQLALDPQGSDYAGHAEHFSLSADPGAGLWRFSADNGYPMECGSVLETSTATARSGVLYQNPDETNYGIPLPSGSYRTITSKSEHETCVFVVHGGLDAAGTGEYMAAVTGTAG